VNGLSGKFAGVTYMAERSERLLGRGRIAT
jgi:hypothetical protein